MRSSVVFSILSIVGTLNYQFLFRDKNKVTELMDKLEDDIQNIDTSRVEDLEGKSFKHKR